MSSERLGASFSIDVTDLKAGLSQANRLIKESKSEFEAATSGLDKYSDAQDIAKAKITQLSKTQELQEEKVSALKNEYKRLVADGMDETSAAAVTLRTKINNEQAALEKTKKELREQTKALEEMGDESKDAAKQQDNLKDQTERTGEGFTVAKGAVAGFISNGLTQLVGACKNAISSLAGLSDSTREYREGLNQLETAFGRAGFSAEETYEAFNYFGSVLGDTRKAQETMLLLSQMVKSEKELASWTDTLTGVYAMYGKAIPTEALTEAINHTVQLGEQVEGNLADALEWGGVGLDDFNKKLTQCTTQEERAQLVQSTLNNLYGDAADKYNELNKSILDASTEQTNFENAQAKLGAQLEPVTTGIMQLKTQFVEGLTPALKSAIPEAKNLVEQIKQDGTIKKFSKSVADLAKTVLPPLAKAVKFCAENIVTIGKVTLTAVTAFKAFKAVMAVTTAITAAKTAIAGLSAGVGVATKAQTVWNAAMSANPIGAVITAVALLTTGIVLLANAQDKTAKATDVLSKSQRETVSAAQEAAKAYRETKAAADELAGSQTANVDYVKNSLLPELQNLVDTNGKVKEGDEARAQFILGELNTALGTEYKSLSDIVDANGKIKDSVYQVIEAKKAQILLEAYEDSYRKAVENVAKAEKARATQAQALAKAEENAKNAQSKAEAYYNEQVALGYSRNKILADARYASLYQEELKTKYTLEEQKKAYDKANSNVQTYYADIGNYETASTLVMQGETEKAVGYLNNLGSGFITAADVAKKSKNEQLKTLKQQVIDTEVNLGLLEADYKSKQGSMTDEEKNQAKARIENAKKQANDAKNEYYKVGGNMVEGMKRGAEDGEWTLTGAFKGLVNKALQAAKKAAGIKSPSRKFRKEVGLQIGLGTALGIQDSTAEIIKSAKEQVKAISNVFDAGAISGELAASVQPSNVAQLGAGKTNGGGVVVYQTNNYAQAHTRNEIYKSKQATAAAVRLALAGV